MDEPTPTRPSAKTSRPKRQAPAPAGVFYLRCLGGTTPSEPILQDWKKLQALARRAAAT